MELALTTLDDGDVMPVTVRLFAVDDRRTRRLFASFAASEQASKRIVNPLPSSVVASGNEDPINGLAIGKLAPRKFVEDLPLLIRQVSEIFRLFRVGHRSESFRSVAGNRRASFRFSLVWGIPSHAPSPYSMDRAVELGLISPTELTCNAGQ